MLDSLSFNYSFIQRGLWREYRKSRIGRLVSDINPLQYREQEPYGLLAGARDVPSSISGRWR